MPRPYQQAQKAAGIYHVRGSIKKNMATLSDDLKLMQLNYLLSNRKSSGDVIIVFFLHAQRPLITSPV